VECSVSSIHNTSVDYIFYRVTHVSPLCIVCSYVHLLACIFSVFSIALKTCFFFNYLIQFALCPNPLAKFFSDYWLAKGIFRQSPYFSLASRLIWLRQILFGCSGWNTEFGYEWKEFICGSEGVLNKEQVFQAQATVIINF